MSLFTKKITTNFDFIDSIISSKFDNSKSISILELGCGQGILSKRISEKYKNFTPCDIEYPNNKIKNFMQADYFNFPRDKKYDFIFIQRPEFGKNWNKSNEFFKTVSELLNENGLFLYHHFNYNSKKIGEEDKDYNLDLENKKISVETWIRSEGKIALERSYIDNNWNIRTINAIFKVFETKKEFVEVLDKAGLGLNSQYFYGSMKGDVIEGNFDNFPNRKTHLFSLIQLKK